MKFTKMQGLGNDYVYVYGEPQNPEELSIRLTERRKQRIETRKVIQVGAKRS